MDGVGRLCATLLDKALTTLLSPYTINQDQWSISYALASTGLPQSTQNAYDLYFTRSGTSDYVIHHGLQITDAFTVCFRMRTAEKTETDGTVLSYSANQIFNEILIKDVAQLELWINDELL